MRRLALSDVETELSPKEWDSIMSKLTACKASVAGLQRDVARAASRVQSGDPLYAELTLFLQLEPKEWLLGCVCTCEVLLLDC